MKDKGWKHLVKKLCRGFKPLFALGFVLTFSFSSTFASSNILDVQTSSIKQTKDADNATQLKINFDKVYDQVITEEAGQGVYSLQFYNTSLADIYSLSDIPDSSLAKIALQPNELGVKLNIEFNNVLQDTTKLVNHHIVDKAVIVTISPPVKTKLAFLATPSTAKANPTNLYSTGIIVILFMLALLLGAYYLVSYSRAKNLTRKRGNRLDYKILDTVNLSAKQKIHLVEINKAQYALNQSGSNIQLLNKVETVENLIKEAQASTAPGRVSSIKAKFKIGPDKFKPENFSSKNFKQELLSRISKLRPLT